LKRNAIYRLCYVVILALGLSSCATTYQKSGFTGGYSETKISESAYTVSFSGNGFASRDRVYFFWIYRCAELTLQKGYSLYVIRSNQTHARNLLPDAAMLPALYTGDNGGEFIKTRGGGGGGVIIIPGGSSGTKWTYHATVLMYKKPLPQEVLWGVDAEQTMALLRPYVTSNGSIPPPSRDELFRKAFLAHARISIGDDATVAVDDVARAANADGSPGRDLHIRTADSIADTVSTTRLIALHAMYRAYVAQLRSLDPAGEVVLEFSVSPNGQVRDCRVTSSTIKDRGFSDAVATLVGQTEFAPLDVGMTRVRHFRISFADLSESTV
jgi:TonB family protein